uniref:Uncharacterized protein n=1 Tax=Glycine max TaxID=3847 RepID=C6SXZ7_SOYBN|nr:unknown [Glycine max]
METRLPKLDHDLQQPFKGHVFITTNSFQNAPYSSFWKSHLNEFLYLIFNPTRRSLGKTFCPVASSVNKCLIVFQILLCHHGILRIIRLRSREKCLHRKKCSLQSECWAPLVLQDIQANSSTLAADIRMPNFGFKLHLGGFKRVPIRQCDINLENAPFIWSSDGARNGADQENKVVVFGADFDARSLRVLAAFHKLLLHARKVYHLQSWVLYRRSEEKE